MLKTGHIEQTIDKEYEFQENDIELWKKILLNYKKFTIIFG